MECLLQIAMECAPFPEHWEACMTYCFDPMLELFLRDVREWRVFARQQALVECPRLVNYMAIDSTVTAELQLGVTTVPEGLSDLKIVWKKITRGSNLGKVQGGTAKRGDGGQSSVSAQQQQAAAQHAGMRETGTGTVVTSLPAGEYPPFQRRELDAYVDCCKKHRMEICCPYTVGSLLFPKSDKFPFGLTACNRDDCELSDPKNLSACNGSMKSELLSIFKHFGRKKGAGQNKGGATQGGAAGGAGTKAKKTKQKAKKAKGKKRMFSVEEDS